MFLFSCVTLSLLSHSNTNDTTGIAATIIQLCPFETYLVGHGLVRLFCYICLLLPINPFLHKRFSLLRELNCNGISARKSYAPKHV